MWWKSHSLWIIFESIFNLLSRTVLKSFLYYVLKAFIVDQLQGFIAWLDMHSTLVSVHPLKCSAEYLSFSYFFMLHEVKDLIMETEIL